MDRDMLMPLLIGYQVLESEYLSKKITCRRHKKKRINKKLNKKYGVKRIELRGEIILADGKIFCSPKTAAVIRRGFRLREKV